MRCKVSGEPSHIYNAWATLVNNGRLQECDYFLDAGGAPQAQSIEAQDARVQPTRRPDGMARKMRSVLNVAIFYLILGISLAQAGSTTLSVTEYHGGPDRSGHYVVPGLTWDRARNVHVEAAFRAEVEGHIYAQPLYWHPPGSNTGLLIVATEENAVYALDSKTGAVIWKRLLGKPVSLSSLSCGNIDPLGITGTPVIDADLQAVYLDAFTSGSGGPEHLIFGLSLRDGSTLPGWPVTVSEAAARRGLQFNSREQDQRGALTVAAAACTSPMGVTSVIVVSITVGSLGCRYTNRRTWSPGRPAQGEVAFGRRAV